MPGGGPAFPLVVARGARALAVGAVDGARRRVQRRAGAAERSRSATRQSLWAELPAQRRAGHRRGAIRGRPGRGRIRRRLQARRLVRQPLASPTCATISSASRSPIPPSTRRRARTTATSASMRWPIRRSGAARRRSARSTCSCARLSRRRATATSSASASTAAWRCTIRCPAARTTLSALGFGFVRLSDSAIGFSTDSAFYNPGVFTPELSYEAVFEATYQFQVTPYAQIQPDLQYVQQPRRRRRRPAAARPQGRRRADRRAARQRDVLKRLAVRRASSRPPLPSLCESGRGGFLRLMRGECRPRRQERAANPPACRCASGCKVAGRLARSDRAGFSRKSMCSSSSVASFSNRFLDTRSLTESQYFAASR